MEHDVKILENFTHASIKNQVLAWNQPYNKKKPMSSPMTQD